MEENMIFFIRLAFVQSRPERYWESLEAIEDEGSIAQSRKFQQTIRKGNDGMGNCFPKTYVWSYLNKCLADVKQLFKIMALPQNISFSIINKISSVVNYVTESFQ